MFMGAGVVLKFIVPVARNRAETRASRKMGQRETSSVRKSLKENFYFANQHRQSSARSKVSNNVWCVWTFLSQQ